MNYNVSSFLRRYFHLIPTQERSNISRYAGGFHVFIGVPVQ